MNRVLRARLGYLLGLAFVTVGMYSALGIGWALVAAGVGIIAAFVFLYDVNDPPGRAVDQMATRAQQLGGGDW